MWCGQRAGAQVRTRLVPRAHAGGLRRHLSARPEGRPHQSFCISHLLLFCILHCILKAFVTFLIWYTRAFYLHSKEEQNVWKCASSISSSNVNVLVIVWQELEAAMRPETILVSIMSVNNEIGVLQPLGALLPTERAPTHILFMRLVLPSPSVEVETYEYSALH